MVNSAKFSLTMVSLTKVTWAMVQMNQN
jgi:hypothetical protein